MICICCISCDIAFATCLNSCCRAWLDYNGDEVATAMSPGDIPGSVTIG